MTIKIKFREHYRKQMDYSKEEVIPGHLYETFKGYGTCDYFIDSLGNKKYAYDFAWAAIDTESVNYNSTIIVDEPYETRTNIPDHWFKDKFKVKLEPYGTMIKMSSKTNEDKCRYAEIGITKNNNITNAQGFHRHIADDGTITESYDDGTVWSYKKEDNETK